MRRLHSRPDLTRPQTSGVGDIAGNQFEPGSISQDVSGLGNVTF